MISAAMKANAFLLITLFFVKMNAEETPVIHEEKGTGKAKYCGNDFMDAHAVVCIDYFKSLGKQGVKASEGHSSNLSFFKHSIEKLHDLLLIKLLALHDTSS